MSHAPKPHNLSAAADTPFDYAGLFAVGWILAAADAALVVDEHRAAVFGRHTPPFDLTGGAPARRATPSSLTATSPTVATGATATYAAVANSVAIPPGPSTTPPRSTPHAVPRAGTQRGRVPAERA